MIDAELASLRPGKVSEVAAIAGPGRIGQKNVPLAVLGQTDVIYDDYMPLLVSAGPQAVYVQQASGLVFYRADPSSTHSEHRRKHIAYA